VQLGARTRSELEQLGNALLEPLFRVARGVRLLGGLSQFGSMLCWFLAVSVLSLGSATALGVAAPLFTTLLSIVILKEKVGIHRWSALIVGFVGVLIITHPGTGTLTYGALFALGNAILISTVAIAIRRMSMTESTETLTLYQMRREYHCGYRCSASNAPARKT
jgi:drug/metabolite transporter (DMT)-like permease